MNSDIKLRLISIFGFLKFLTRRSFWTALYKAARNSFAALGLFVTSIFGFWKQLPEDRQKELYQNAYYYLRPKADIMILTPLIDASCHNDFVKDAGPYAGTYFVREGVKYLQKKGLKVYADETAAGLDRLPPRYTIKANLICETKDPQQSKKAEVLGVLNDAPVENRVSSFDRMDEELNGNGKKNERELNFRLNMLVYDDRGFQVESFTLEFEEYMFFTFAGLKDFVMPAILDSIEWPSDLSSKMQSNYIKTKYNASDMVFYRGAMFVAENDNLEGAITLLKLATTNNPRFAMAFWAISEICSVKGDAKCAEENLAKARSIEDEFPKIPIVNRAYDAPARLKIAIKSAETRVITDGLIYKTAGVREWDLAIHMLKIDFRKFKMQLAMSPSSKGSTAHEFRENKKAIFAMVGGMFDIDAQKNLRPSGLLIIDGIKVAELRDTSFGGVLSVKDGTPKITPIKEFSKLPSQNSSDNYFALQTNLLVVDPGGQNGIWSKTPERASRAAFCINDENNGTAIILDGEIDLYSFGDILAEKAADGGIGCERAINLDGGPSTQASLSHGDFEINLKGGWNIPNALVLSKREGPLKD